MYLGRIVEIGEAEEVLANPQHPYTKALLSVVPEMQRVEQQILTGETPDPSRIPAGCRFHPRCPLVASGEAERLGILGRCTGVDVELAAARRRPLVRLPRPPLTVGPEVRWSGLRRLTDRIELAQRRRAISAPSSCTTSSISTSKRSWSDRTDKVDSVRTLASGHVISKLDEPRAQPIAGSTVETPSSPR